MMLNPNKEALLDNWTAVLNAILKASEGEMEVHYIKPKVYEGGEIASVPKDAIEGVYVEILLKFPRPIKPDFTKEERKILEDALAE